MPLKEPRQSIVVYAVLRRSFRPKTESLTSFAKFKFDLSAFDVLQSPRINTYLYTVYVAVKTSCFFKVTQVLNRVQCWILEVFFDLCTCRNVLT